MRACDSFLVDFKIASVERSRSVTDMNVSLRDENLMTLLGLGARIVARMPIIPGHTDGAANVLANSKRICELGISRVDVLPFHQLGEVKYVSSGRPYPMAGMKGLSEADVAGVVDILEADGLEVMVHGE